MVTLYIPSISAESNTTAATLTGLPTEIQPTQNQRCYYRAVDSGANFEGTLRVRTTGNTIDLYKNVSLGAFTGSGTKGVGECSVTYLLS